MLFLDELPEFGRAAVEALRQPLEDGRVTIVRGQRALEFPANAMVVATCNRVRARAPPSAAHAVPPIERRRYLRRLSGPLLDRIDLVCEVDRAPAPEPVGDERPRASSAQVRDRVIDAASGSGGGSTAPRPATVTWTAG